MTIDEARIITLAALNDRRFAKRMWTAHPECTSEELEQLKQKIKQEVTQLDEAIKVIETVCLYAMARQVDVSQIIQSEI